MPTELRRSGPIRRKARPKEDRVTLRLHQFVMLRDNYTCIARRFDPKHVCQGPLTFEHVPEAGKNAIGKRAPSNRWHGVAACLSANSPEGWCSTNRESERNYLATHYGEPPYPDGQDELNDDPDF